MTRPSSVSRRALSSGRSTRPGSFRLPASEANNAEPEVLDPTSQPAALTSPATVAKCGKVTAAPVGRCQRTATVPAVNEPAQPLTHPFRTANAVVPGPTPGGGGSTFTDPSGSQTTPRSWLLRSTMTPTIVPSSS